MTNQQLYLAIGIPALMYLLAWYSNRVDFRELRAEVNALRVELASFRESVNVRLAIIETKLGIPPQKEKDAAEAAE